MLPEEGNHFAGNIAFVETVARGSDAGASAFAFARAFGFHHAMQRVRESGSLMVSPARSGAIGLIPIRLVGGPLSDECVFAADGVDGAGANGKALPGVVEGGVATSSKLMVPIFEDGRAAWMAPGTTAGSSPCPESVLLR